MLTGTWCSKSRRQTKLQHSAANNDSEQYDSLVSEIDKLSAALCAFKVNKDDAKTDVDNLSFLFEYTQAFLEVRSYALKQEEDAVKRTMEAKLDKKQKTIN